MGGGLTAVPISADKSIPEGIGQTGWDGGHPFLCLAAVSLLGFLGVVAIGAALPVIASIKSGLSDRRSPGDVMEGGA